MTAPFPHCRFFGSKLAFTLLDLGETPLSLSYVTAEDLKAGCEPYYPLHARVCRECLLVQVDDSVPPDEIFSDYLYFSSYSDSWVEHARRYCADMKERLGLGPDSLVVEVASNDGYLLKHFKTMGVPVLGVEPAANVAAAAEQAGVPTHVAFFGEATANHLKDKGKQADLMVANNVLAHVPGTLDFVKGFATLLKPEGIATFEFPHVLNLIEEIQFDTIYHEHFFYLSLHTVELVFAAAGLRVFDVEEVPTHGGSLRLFACRKEASHREAANVEAMRQKEHAARLDGIEGYEGFDARVREVKRGFRDFLARAKAENKRVAAYGAAAKGNTFLNYCGVGTNDIECVFDRSREKQGHLLPGSHLPVLAPESIAKIRPDYLIILPWNLAREISASHAYIKDWGGRFVIALPKIEILEP